MLSTLIEKLQELHGEPLKIKEQVYFLFLKDGMASLYYDEVGKTIKLDVEFLNKDQAVVYEARDMSLERIFEKVDEIF
jgi:hypothetical protein